MSYSTIKRKKCKCGCSKYPSIGYGGYAYSCAPKEILDRVGSKKDVQKRNKAIIAKNSRELYKHTAEQLSAENKAEISPQDRWYFDRRLEMTNVCINCGSGTNKINPKYYRWSIAHVVPKSLCPSVAMNEHNWVELCQQCHAEYDNTFDRAAAMDCFGEIKQKFQLFKHLIPNHEMRKVNPHLLNQL